MSRFPEDLKYSREHEWVREGNGRTVRIGITDYAAEALGDIVYVSLPTVGEEVAAGDSCGELESTKSVSDVFSPVSGVVTAVNDALTENPATVNAEPFGDGWLFEVELAPAEADDDLLDADEYASHVGE
ncbi:glycine cleavage system protein GcvH [Aestuariimicrobium sp. T2.26MG-19.2B]|uniref:glycine cleavage system protein GcvH n=1 Tax=Aestuariimicrobium sp. T2.26MG-19.2B TaxID=3040679 RepID=UPI0024775512|nr:glycine cleavage system protein GcvH [Aestuariimicrobium sp. T2.26MG-19.2B]CAI9408921.1 Glycine cleavage system H protein [Aestuariimicrobium sp. T2.26MG-19.2B]